MRGKTLLFANYSLQRSRQKRSATLTAAPAFPNSTPDLQIAGHKATDKGRSRILRGEPGMNVAVSAKKTPAVEFLDNLTGLIHAGKFKEASEAYKTFEKEHSTADFLILEALPFRLETYIVKKLGSSTAFSIYTLRHPNWAVEAVKAFEDPAGFESFVKELEAEVVKLAGK